MKTGKMRNRMDTAEALDILDSCLNGDDGQGAPPDVPRPPDEIMNLTEPAEEVTENPFEVPTEEGPFNEASGTCRIEMNPEDVIKASAAPPIFNPAFIAAPTPEDTQPEASEKVDDSSNPKLGPDNDPVTPEEKGLMDPKKSKWVIVGAVVGICAMVIAAAAYKGCSNDKSMQYTPPGPIPTVTQTAPPPAPPPAPTPTLGSIKFDAAKCRDDQMTLRSDGTYVFSDCVSVH